MTKTIPKGWDLVELSTVANNIMYGMNAAAGEYDGVNKYIRITDIDEKTRRYVPNPLSTPKGDISITYMVNEGDILFARTGASTGKSYIYSKSDGKLFFAGFLIRFHIFAADPRYIYYQTLLPSYQNWVSSVSIRSGQPGINAEQYKTLEILLPPLPEQEKIVEVLETWDSYFEKLSASIKLKKKVKKGLMQRLFTGKMRLKSFNEPWKSVKLEEACKINPKSESLPSTFVYIDLESVEKGILKKERSMKLENAPSRAQRLLHKKDILFQMVRPYQKNNLYFNKDSNYVASTGYAQIRTQNDPKYLYYILHTDSFVNKVLEKCTGSNYPAINSTDLSKIKIPLPSIPEQKAIGQILTTADQEIEALEKKKALIEQQKKFLLNNMITGKLRLPEFIKVSN
jgi:type I restriction enzyme S subunit